MGVAAFRHFKAALGHYLLEAVSLLGLFDGLQIRA